MANKIKLEDHMGIQSGDYTMERPFQIYNDKDGSRIEFGPDKDSLGLYEIREYVEIDNVDKVINRLVLTQDQVQLLAIAFEEATDKHAIVRSHDRD